MRGLRRGQELNFSLIERLSSRYLNRMDTSQSEAAEELRSVLISHFDSRKLFNHAYSLRRFARDIGLSPSNLADILSGRCGISSTSGKRIANALGLTTVETARFMDLIEAAHSRSKTARTLASQRLQTEDHSPAMKQFAGNDLDILKRWYFLAALELVDLTKGFLSAESISQLLNISRDEAAESLHFLEKAQYVRREGERFVRNDPTFFHRSETPSKNIQNFHRQVLEKTVKAIADVPPEHRELSTTMFCFDRNRMSEVKSAIAKFEDEFFRKFCSEIEGNTVYTCSVQFVPMSMSLLQHPS